MLKTCVKTSLLLLLRCYINPLFITCGQVTKITYMFSLIDILCCDSIYIYTFILCFGNQCVSVRNQDTRIRAVIGHLRILYACVPDQNQVGEDKTRIFTGSPIFCMGYSVPTYLLIIVFFLSRLLFLQIF